jgi:hypothetical protein
VGTNNLLEKTQYQMTSFHVLTMYYPGQKEENDVLNCESRSEVCSVTEKGHNKTMRGLGVSEVTNVLLHDIW